MAIFTVPKKIKIAHREYEITEYLGRGGSGEVYRAKVDALDVAIKLFLPFHERRQLQVLPEVASTKLPAILLESINFQRREFDFIARISHPNVVRALDVDTYTFLAGERKRVEQELGVPGIERAPVLVSELVEGLPIDDAIARYQLSADEIAYALTRVADALDHIHQRHTYLHNDVKPANVLVREDIREPILIDFALTKNFNFDEVEADGQTLLLGDWDLLPTLPDNHPLKNAKTTETTRRDLMEQAFPALDLYDFGLMLRELRPLCEAAFEERELRYLSVLEYELTHWDRVRQWAPGELGRRVARLRPSESTPFGIPELAAPGVPEHTLVVPEAKAVPITKAVTPILGTASFARLGSVNQLSLLDLVYPAADYKRRVHVLYAYELARQLVAHLYSSARFRYLFDEQSVQHLLLVTLLHDINHFPFLHTIQESQLDEARKLRLFDLVCDGELTGERAAGRPSIYDLLEEQGLEPDRFKRLVHGPFAEQADEKDQVISSIVNSGVDVDKLSYLRLDAYFTGVPYGSAIDIATLLKAATIAHIGGSKFHLAFEERALSAVEHAVFTRYWNFRSIYWHHTNRALMAMVLEVVRKVYENERGGLRRYIEQTAFSGEWEAVRFLDREHRSIHGRPSILNRLDRDRTVMYKRLYTLHPATDDADRELFASLRHLSLDGELAFRTKLALRLREELPEGQPVDSDDVLVDIPRRELDLGGAVWVQTTDLGVGKLTSLSKPIEFLSQHYSELSQRARVFVSPRVRDALRATGFYDDRDAIRSMLSEALSEGAGPSEIR